MNCPDCNKELASTDLDVDRLVANCPQCGAEFGFSRSLLDDRVSTPPSSGDTGLIQSRPVDESYGPFRLQYEYDSLKITRLWLSLPSAIAFVAINVVAVIAYWVVPFIFHLFGPDSSTQFDPQGMQFLHLLPYIFLLSGGLAYYFSLVLVVNRTIYTIDGQTMKTRHGPLPLRPKLDDIDLSETIGILVKKHTIRVRSGAGMENSIQKFATVSARSKDDITVLVHCSDAQAAFIGKAIAQHLNVKYYFKNKILRTF